jgi:hypothetical protein
MTLHVFGDSHVGALAEAYEGEPGRFGDVRFASASARYVRQRFFYPVPGGALLSRPARKLPGPGRMALVTRKHPWAFVLGTHTAAFFRDETWAAFAPAHLVRPPRQALSAAAMETMIAAALKQVLDFIDTLLGAGVPFCMVAAPPPRPDHPALQEGGTREIRLEAARLYRRWALAQFVGRGVPVISPPPCAIDDEGLLRPEYRSARPRDTHHANAAYGALMLEQIIRCGLTVPDC